MPNNINWYPGHMKKTRELIAANLKPVDLVIELIDARIPLSSRNPVIDELIKNKKRLIILNKADLADDVRTEEWLNRLNNGGDRAVKMDSLHSSNMKKLYGILDEYQKERDRVKRNPRPIRMMIVGIPNVGKSSFINRLIGRKGAKTGNKPGVTRGKQWVSLSNGMQLLDTPGILWPKLEDPNVGLNLAFCGSIKDEILDTQDLCFELLKVLEKDYPDKLMERYKLDSISEDTLENMDNIARKRGFILSGGRIDYERTGRTVLDEFRAGKIGRITLERA